MWPSQTVNVTRRVTWNSARIEHSSLRSSIGHSILLPAFPFWRYRTPFPHMLLYMVFSSRLFVRNPAGTGANWCRSRFSSFRPGTASRRNWIQFWDRYAVLPSIYHHFLAVCWDSLQIKVHYMRCSSICNNRKVVWKTQTISVSISVSIQRANVSRETQPEARWENRGYLSIWWRK